MRPPARFMPKYADLPAHRREQIAHHFDLAMTELKRAGKHEELPLGRVEAMWGDLLRLPENSITTPRLMRIYLKHAKK